MFGIIFHAVVIVAASYAFYRYAKSKNAKISQLKGRIETVATHLEIYASKAETTVQRDIKVVVAWLRSRI